MMEARQKTTGRLLLCCMLAIAVAMTFIPVTASHAAAVKKVKKPTVTVTDQTLTAAWKKVSKARGYKVVIKDSESNVAYKANTKKKTVTTEALEAGQYRVHVKAWKKVNGKKKYGKWSKWSDWAVIEGSSAGGVSWEESVEGGLTAQTDANGLTTMTVSAAGTYTLSGAGSNTVIEVAKELTGVELVLKDLTIDNSALTSDDPVIYADKSTEVTVTLSGKNTIKGAGAYTEEAANALIYQKGGSLTIAGSGSLSLQDSIGSDGIRSKGTVNVTSGSLDIDVYGDGIQGETINISDGTLDIVTYYENAGVNFYNSKLPVYNTLTTNGDTVKIETVNIDTGSHKGIKAGSKAETYSYTTVEDGSEYTAGQEYTEEASGGLTISGGTINIDTTNTGAKYNSGSMGGMGGQNASSGSGNLTTVDDKVILGAPEDAIKSNNDATISGGTITINAADDGISVANTVNFTGKAVVDVQQAFEGIEAQTIKVGTGSDSPSVSVYSFDDGTNSTGKTVNYVYANEDETQYTKTTTSTTTGNDTIVNSGSLTVAIGDDTTHTYSLPVSSEYTSYTGGTPYTGSFSADGDGIDCNGSFYARGGKTVVWGVSGNSANSAVDVNDTYQIAGGEVLTASGSANGMDAGPSLSGQYAVTYSSSISSGSAFSIKDSSGNELISLTAPKTIGYVMYTSPSMVSAGSYDLYIGSTNTATATASSSVSGGSQGPGDSEVPGGTDGPGGSGSSDGPGGSGGPGGQQ